MIEKVHRARRREGAIGGLLPILHLLQAGVAHTGKTAKGGEILHIMGHNLIGGRVGTVIRRGL